jgi:hypothetical protein
MDAGALIVIALLLACPLLMVFMHRGGHGAHHSHTRRHSSNGVDDLSAAASRAELRQRREALEAELVRLENAELDIRSGEPEREGASAVLPGRTDGSQ